MNDASSPIFSSPPVHSRISSVRLHPENYEYGDESQMTYALLNGKRPEGSKMNIPRAAFTVDLEFAEGVDFPAMARQVEDLRSLIVAACRMEVVR